MSVTSPTNPFSVFTPEGLDAERVVAIFSTAMPGLDNLKSAGHAFVVGPRGSGKSILFRYLEPDCQMIVTGKTLGDLDFISLYVSFRETEAHISELARFEHRHGAVFFNEHLLVLAIAARVTSRLYRAQLHRTPSAPLKLRDALRSFFASRKFDPISAEVGAESQDTLATLSHALQESYRNAIGYIKKHAFRSDVIPYDGELFGFDDFLLPYLTLLKDVLCVSPEQHLFLLLDDADSLTEIQARVVNSWVARRLSSECSLKIAAQYTAYKTLLTTSDRRIEAPHDYQSIDLSEINTRPGLSRYSNRISTIVTQRLRTVGMQQWSDKYFPEDHRQEIGVDRERQLLITNWMQGEGRGARSRDDVQRYARPEYIRKLGGTRKSRSKYSYSGFEQLVHISSGVTRFFLEAAADMYDRSVAAGPQVIGREVTSIDPTIQSQVIREHAERQFVWDIRDLRRDVEKLHGTPLAAVRLHNLINGLGSLFEAAIMDEHASERKYFSFAFSDTPDLEVEDVLDLGLRYGYLFKSIIGRKEGRGRTPLYILSRRLAPLFNLDPMGFAAYKFMTADTVRALMDQPDWARKNLRRFQGYDGGSTQTLLPFAEDVIRRSGRE